MSWFLYMLECSDGSVYTGIATDVQARFDKHASGAGARYTRSRKPVRVLISFELTDRASASRAEYWVKRLTPAAKRALAAGERTLESVMPVVVIEADLAADLSVPIDADVGTAAAPTAEPEAALQDTEPAAGQNSGKVAKKAATKSRAKQATRSKTSAARQTA
jgi:putative endonuclease